LTPVHQAEAPRSPAQRPRRIRAPHSATPTHAPQPQTLPARTPQRRVPTKRPTPTHLAARPAPPSPTSQRPSRLHTVVKGRPTGRQQHQHPAPPGGGGDEPTDPVPLRLDPGGASHPNAGRRLLCRGDLPKRSPERTCRLLTHPMSNIVQSEPVRKLAQALRGTQTARRHSNPHGQCERTPP